MEQAKKRFAEFYRPQPEWPDVFVQGDVVEGVARLVIAKRDAAPTGGSLDTPVVGEANYSTVRAMVISPTCNLRPGQDTFIQMAVVENAPSLGKDKEKELRDGRRHKVFLLHDHPRYGKQIAKLTDVWSVTPEHLAGLTRILCLSDWGRSLLVDALYRAFARPITDPEYCVEDYERLLPASP